MMLQQIKLYLLGIIAVLRRAFCCLTRRRKLSGSDEQLQAVSVIVGTGDCNDSNSNYGQSTRYATTTAAGSYKERDWNSWDERPRTVEEHIEAYRQRCAKPAAPPPPAPEEPIEQSLFTELTPVIQPQTRYYLGSTTEPSTAESHFTRLQAQQFVSISTSPDLQDWTEDTESGGWDELDAEQTKQLLRDKQRELRQQRQHALKAKAHSNTIAASTVQAKRLYAGNNEQT